MMILVGEHLLLFFFSINSLFDFPTFFVFMIFVNEFYLKEIEI